MQKYIQIYFFVFRLDYAESSAIATMLDSMGVEEFCMRYMVAIKQALFQVRYISLNIQWRAKGPIDIFKKIPLKT